MDSHGDSHGDSDGAADPTAGRHRVAPAWRPLLRWLPRRMPPRLVLAAGGGAAALVAAAVAVAVSLGAGAAPACAAHFAPPAAATPPVAGTEYAGQATHYRLESGGGNCSYPEPPADDLYAALSPGEYGAAAACGGYLDVTGPEGTVRVKVVDQCPECATGHIDLSREAFDRIADLAAGIVPVTYQLVADPPLPGPLGFRVKEGASQWWFAVLVFDHGNPLATVAARTAGGDWRPLAREDYNYWLAEGGLGPGPYQLRLTDVAGHDATVAGVALAPEQLQTSDVRMYGGGDQPPPPPPPPSSPPPPPSAGSPSAGPTPAAPVAAARAGSPSPAPACR